MPIKTILLHMSNDERHSQRLEAAAILAKRFSAFVEVLFVATPVSMPAAVTGRAASYAYIAEATAIAHEKAEQIEQEVRQTLKDCSYSWTIEEGDHVELLAARAVYADLAVVTQSHDDERGDRVALQVPDRLPLTSPCPTLVLPYAAPLATAIGRHVVVAWKNTREAGRAVRNALPFLKEAERVTVVTIDPPGHRLDSGRDLMIWLERHGVRSQHQATIFQGGDVGDVLISSCRELGGDLLVMGSYGHSRLREMVLGGATRTVLANLDVPVLMSH